MVISEMTISRNAPKVENTPNFSLSKPKPAAALKLPRSITATDYSERTRCHDGAGGRTARGDEHFRVFLVNDFETGGTLEVTLYIVSTPWHDAYTG